MRKSAEALLVSIFGSPSITKENGDPINDINELSEAEYQDYLCKKYPEKSEVYKREKKLKLGKFADQIRFEYFLTGEADWHRKDITHKVIEKNPNMTTMTVSDLEMLIRPDLPLESDDKYLREPDCATFSLRTIVNGKIIWENTSLGQLLKMYKNDGEYQPFTCGCGMAICAGISDSYNIKTVHTDQHVILYMKKYAQVGQCGPMCYRFYTCRNRNGKCTAFKAKNVISEFKFDKYEFKQQIFAIISSRIAIENIHKVWETPEDDQQALSDQEIGERLTRLFCTSDFYGEYEVKISKEIRQLRQEMIMEAIQYHKDHYHPEEQEQEPKQ